MHPLDQILGDTVPPPQYAQGGGRYPTTKPVENAF